MLSLETCEKLKAAGWDGKSAHWRYADGELMCDTYIDWGLDEYSHIFKPEVFTACPTLEELLEAIRAELLDTDGYVVLSDGGDRWVVSIDYVSDDGLKLGQCNYTHKDPSEAAAALWLKRKGVV